MSICANVVSMTSTQTARADPRMARVAAPPVPSATSAGTTAQAVHTTTSATTAVADSPGWLKCTKDAAATLQSVATIVALVIGAWWVLRRRRTYPRANFAHSVTSVPLNGEVTLIRVAVEIENIGDVLLTLATSMAGIQQVVPVPDQLHSALANRAAFIGSTEPEMDWPFIDLKYHDWTGSYIEPGEAAAFHFELLAPASVRTVLVYSYFRNITRPGDQGWNTSALYEVRVADVKVV
jgi:hypothetical protein